MILLHVPPDHVKNQGFTDVIRLTLYLQLCSITQYLLINKNISDVDNQIRISAIF